MIAVLSRFLFLALLVGFAAPFASSQVRKPKAKPKPTPSPPLKVTRIKYDDKPFNPQQELVPVGYEGHDPESIAIQIYIGDAYSRKNKGEFETTEEYQRKIDEALNKPMCCSFAFGGEPLTLRSLFAFKIRGFLSLYLDMAYDADKGVMEMAVLPAPYEGDDRYERSLYGENTFTLLQGRISDKQVPYFTTQTKKRVMVRSVRYPLYKITILNMKDFRVENFTPYDERRKGTYYPGVTGKKAIIARVKMSGDEAKTLKGNDSYVVSDDKGVRIMPRVEPSLNALFVGYLTSPYLVKDYSEQKATLYKPTNVERDFYYMNFSLKQIWFYNSKTGKIYAKVGSRYDTSTQASDSTVKALPYARTTSIETDLKAKEVQEQLDKAKALYKAGSDDEALAQIRRILANEPMTAEAYYLVGKIHVRRGDIDQAISSFKTAIFWDNRLVDAHISLGKIYVEKGDCQQAKTYAASALEIDSKSTDALALQRLSERCSR